MSGAGKAKSGTGNRDGGVNPTAWLEDANTTRGTPARRAASKTV